ENSVSDGQLQRKAVGFVMSFRPRMSEYQIQKSHEVRKGFRGRTVVMRSI
ncbi:3368_t:CDS:2, partial [Dentiscutata erythropus]